MSSVGCGRCCSRGGGSPRAADPSGSRQSPAQAALNGLARTGRGRGTCSTAQRTAARTNSSGSRQRAQRAGARLRGRAGTARAATCLRSLAGTARLRRSRRALHRRAGASFATRANEQTRSHPKRPRHRPSVPRQPRKPGPLRPDLGSGGDLTDRPAAANLPCAVDDGRLRRKSSAWMSHPRREELTWRKVKSIGYWVASHKIDQRRRGRLPPLNERSDFGCQKRTEH